MFNRDIQKIIHDLIWAEKDCDLKFFLSEITNQINNFMSKKEFLMDKIDFEVIFTSTIFPHCDLNRNVKIVPKNLYTGLILCGIEVPFSLLENSDRYEDDVYIYFYDKEKSFYGINKSIIKFDLEMNF